jgi:hypothetical protein
LRAAPNATMRALIDRLGLTEGHGKDYGTYFRSTPDPQPAELFDANLLRRATEIYDRLCEYAVR